MNCLENIIKFRTFCETINNQNQLFVEDFVEVNEKLLANLANESELTGKKYGENLINSAVQNVTADIMTASGNVVLENKVIYSEFKGEFNNDQIANGGVQIRNVKHNELTRIKITSLRIKPFFDGNFIVVIDDGNKTEFNLIAENGIEYKHDIDFESGSSIIKIYPKDESLFFAKITASKTTCPSCSGKIYDLVNTPLLNGTATNIYSTVIPESYLFCSGENLTCLAIKNPQIKQLFVKAIAFHVGIMFYERLKLSTRFNDTTLNINKDAVEEYLNTLIGKYRELVFGFNFSTGIKRSNLIPLSELVSRNLRNNKNNICINCNAIFNLSTAIF